MSDKEDNIKELVEKKEHMREWLKRYHKAGEVVPSVEKNLEVTEWELEVLRNPQIQNQDEATLKKQIEEDARELKKNLPMMPTYGPRVINLQMAFTTAASSVVFSGMFHNPNWAIIEPPAETQKYIIKYKSIQEAHKREEEVHELIKKFSIPSLVDLFVKTHQFVYEAKSNQNKITSAANEMRNLIEKLKGELFDKARQWPKENMTWQTMSKRLSGETSIEQGLILQEKVHSQLFNDLSDVLKDRVKIELSTIQNIWARMLDYLYVILNFVT